MRAGLFFLINILLFISVVDGLLYFQLKKYFRSGHPSKIIQVIFWSIPIIFIAGFIHLFVKNTGNIDAQGYYAFTMMNGAFLIFYIPKATYVAYSIIYQFCIRIISFFSWRKNSKKVKNEHKGRKITRASFLGKAGTIVAAAPFLSLLYGLAKGRFNFHVKKVNLAFNNLPKEFDGLKIIHISDIHLGNFNKEYHRLHQVTGMINAQEPDLILMTGDLVNNFASETQGWETVFSKMKARLGKFSILGNHDYGDYSRWKTQHAKRRNFEEICAAHNRFGFKLLKNEHVKVENGAASFSLLGVENWGKPPFPQYGNLDDALNGVPKNDFKLLLSHDPDHWEEEVRKTDIDLTLAGHTHGMQFGVKWRNSVWSPAKWKYKYWDGHYQRKKQHLYVNRGLGFIGIPMRVGMPPEITLITLASKA